MENKITHEYHGERITFNEQREEWGVVMDHKEQFHKSLQVIKNYVDRRNKKKFTRVPVFVKERYGYNSNVEKYEKAVITSVGVDGTIFIVRESQKHAEHCGRAYTQSPKNEKLIGEIGLLIKERDLAKEKLDNAQKKLTSIDFEALRKKALGEKA